jgi:4-carboxymuconolactone decarboxylase
MARLSLMDREALPEDERRFFDAVKTMRGRPISGPFIVLMNGSPDLASRFAHLGHYFHPRGQADESVLSVRARSFTALAAARVLDAPYEWNAWVAWAVEAGIPRATVDALRSGRRPDELEPEEAIVLDLVTELLAGNHRLSGPTFRAALDRFGVQGLVELVATVGYFAMLAYPLNAFEIELSPQQAREREGAPLGLDIARRANP